MGSIKEGKLVGFMCRLCSRMNRYVVLIYSEEGRKLHLEEKINVLLPSKIFKHDSLPKTICWQCLTTLEQHFKMVLMIKKSRKLLEERMMESSPAESDAKSEDSLTDVTSASSDVDVANTYDPD